MAKGSLVVCVEDLGPLRMPAALLLAGCKLQDPVRTWRQRPLRAVSYLDSCCRPESLVRWPVKCCHSEIRTCAFCIDCGLSSRTLSTGERMSLNVPMKFCKPSVYTKNAIYP